MSAENISEMLFEHVCEKSDFEFTKIPRSNNRTPDYDLTVLGLRYVAEIKQSDPTEEELQRLEALPSGEVFCSSFSIGAYVRDRIGNAIRQFDAYVSEPTTTPTILVFFNNRPFMMGQVVDEYQIRTAMYGNDAIFLSVPEGYEEAPRQVGRGESNNGRMTPSSMRLISAVGLLSYNEQGVSLDVYHNDFAFCNINPLEFCSESIAHYKVNRGGNSEYSIWGLLG